MKRDSKDRKKIIYLWERFHGETFCEYYICCSMCSPLSMIMLYGEVCRLKSLRCTRCCSERSLNSILIYLSSGCFELEFTIEFNLLLPFFTSVGADIFPTVNFVDIVAVSGVDSVPERSEHEICYQLQLEKLTNNNGRKITFFNWFFLLK